jgi:hypothetical protein
MKQNKIALRVPTSGPCNTSPIHSSFVRSASNRPNATACPDGRMFKPTLTKWRWIVRSAGPDPSRSRMIRTICAAVRSGASRFNATANSSTAAGVRGTPSRAAGTSASNPPSRHARTHRSSVTRETRTRSPHGVKCSRAASSRTASPRRPGGIAATSLTIE